MARVDGKEQAVDDILHASMMDTILKFSETPHRRTIVLVTGDGNRNHERTTFPDVLEQALRKGFKVELWCWQNSASSVYTRFKKEYFTHFKQFFLDDHRYSDYYLFKITNVCLMILLFYFLQRPNCIFCKPIKEAT